MTILKASSMEAADQVHSNLPSWMPKSNSGAVSNGFGDATKVCAFSLNLPVVSVKT